jgi:hypothetical protein
MGYLHVDNLYKDQQILQFKRVYALEKVHGTSAHVSWKDGKLGFFSGGESYDRFVSLFDHEELVRKFTDKFGQDDRTIIVYGEAYGGKQQGMSATYGPDLRFVAFDVLIGDCWLQVEHAHSVCRHLGLEFVDYEQIDSTLAEIDRCRDLPSTQAARNGVPNWEATIREGVVLRPVFEVTLNNGRRLIAKHKRDEFRESKSPRVERDPTQVEAKLRMDAFVEEHVTPRRFEHVVDQLIREREDKLVQMQDIPALIKLMREDILREEGHGLAVPIRANDGSPDGKALDKAVGTKVVKFVKEAVDAQLRK